MLQVELLLLNEVLFELLFDLILDYLSGFWQHLSEGGRHIDPFFHLFLCLLENRSLLGFCNGPLQLLLGKACVFNVFKGRDKTKTVERFKGYETVLLRLVALEPLIESLGVLFHGPHHHSLVVCVELIADYYLVLDYDRDIFFDLFYASLLLPVLWIVPQLEGHLIYAFLLLLKEVVGEGLHGLYEREEVLNLLDFILWRDLHRLPTHGATEADSFCFVDSAEYILLFGFLPVGYHNDNAMLGLDATENLGDLIKGLVSKIGMCSGLFEQKNGIDLFWGLESADHALLLLEVNDLERAATTDNLLHD